MTQVPEAIKAQFQMLAREWANEYGALFKGSAENITLFFAEIAEMGAVAMLEDDQEALALLKSAGYSMVVSYKLELEKTHRSTVQRGIRLLISAVQVLAAFTGNAIATGVAKAVDAALNKIDP